MEVFPNIRISEGAIARYHTLMERAWGGGFFSEQLWKASKAFLQSEQAYRSAMLTERLYWPPAEGLDLPTETAENYTDRERIYNDLGIAHLSAARDSLRGFMQTAFFSELTDLYIPEHTYELEYARFFFIAEVIRSGIPPDEAKRVANEYATQMDIAIRQGYAGLIDGVIGEIEKLIEYRQKGKRGRQLGSPMPVWKISLLAILTGTHIGAIIACFKTRKQQAQFGVLAGSMVAWVAIVIMLGC